MTTTPAANRDTRLVGPQGEVAVQRGIFQTGLLSGSQLEVLTPEVLLAPNTDYTVTSLVGSRVLTSFRTGSGLDTDSPPLPSELGRALFAERTPGSSCGPSHQVIFPDIEWEGLFLFVDIRATGASPPTALALAMPHLNNEPPYLFSKSPWDRVAIGKSFCTRWPYGLAEGTMWYGTVDLSGNFSGWLEAGAVALPPLPPPDGGVDAQPMSDAGPPDGPGEDATPNIVDATGVAAEAGQDTASGSGGCALAGTAP